MKRYLVLAAALVGLLFLGWYWRSRQENISRTPSERADATGSVDAAKAGDTNGEGMPPRSQASPPNSPASSPSSAPQPLVKNDQERMPEIFSTYNSTHNKPIDFCGRVVDQDTNAVPGAIVTVTIQQTYMTSPTEFQIASKQIRLERQSGVDGRFEIRGELGEGVTVESVQKQGYKLEPGQKTYGTQVGTAEEPVMFTLWSTNVHERLTTGDKKFQLVPDGRHYGIDLSNGTIAERSEGDLVVWIQRPQSVTPGEKYGWSCGMATPSGGLLQVADSYVAMSTAPVAGYTNVFAYQQAANVSGWGDGTGEKRFYLKLHDGQVYGCIIAELFPSYHGITSGLIRLQYILNPSGSRVLR